MSQPQQVSVTDLDVSQLSDVRRQLEEVGRDVFYPSKFHWCRATQELNHLTNSFAQLKQAQAKFKSCIENVGEVKPQNKGAPSIPLSSSYVALFNLSHQSRQNHPRAIDQLPLCTRKALRPWSRHCWCRNRIFCAKGSVFGWISTLQV